jgi:hypothetical protein
MFEFIPDMVWHIMLIGSALLLFVTAFFSFIPYRLPVGILSAFVLALTLWVEGGIANEAKWQAEIDKMKVALAEAEKKATQKNVEIQEKVVYKDKVVKERGAAQIQYIDRIVQGDTIKETIVKDMTPEQRAEYEKKVAELQSSIKNCPVPKIVIEEHNKAAVKAINDAAKGDKK